MVLRGCPQAGASLRGLQSQGHAWQRWKGKGALGQKALPAAQARPAGGQGLTSSSFLYSPDTLGSCEAHAATEHLKCG